MTRPALTVLDGVRWGEEPVVGARSQRLLAVLAAATALAGLVGDELTEEMVIPSPFDPRVGPAVASAVSAAARRDGVARR